MRYDDWGVRSARWAGLRSVSTTVCGVPVHHVRADPAADVGADAPVHVMVPPMTGSASMWLDLVPHLARLGPVVAVDLPGTVTGHSGDPYRHGPSADLDARFVTAFVRGLHLDRRVVLHGWSTGGLVAALAAAAMPDRTHGVVLLAPALPWRRTSRLEGLWWQTFGRLAVAAGPPVARAALTLAGRRLLDAQLVALRDGGASGSAVGVAAGGHRERVSGEQVDLWLDDLEAARERPRRFAGTATAYASAVDAMFVHRGRTDEALDRVRPPVLVLWGGEDRLVDPPSLAEHVRRRGWTARAVEGVGHLLPVEAPDRCADAVGEWLGGRGPAQRVR